MAHSGAYRCPKCQAPTAVIETRQTGRAEIQKRRRECISHDCGTRFNTFEVPESLFLEFQHGIAALESFKEALSQINAVNGQAAASLRKGG